MADQLTNDDRAAHWRAGVKAMGERRATYTPERMAYYERIAVECLKFLRPSGDVLDVGAGTGGMRERLACTSYVGVDPGEVNNPHVRRAIAESLPFTEETFDTVLFYSSLQHVLDPVRALAEAHRVLRPGGALALQVSVNDRNPLFMHHWSEDGVTALVEAAGFTVEATRMIERRMVCVRGVKHG